MSAVLMSLVAGLTLAAQVDAGPQMPAETDAKEADVARSSGLEPDRGEAGTALADAGTVADTGMPAPPGTSTLPSPADDIEGRISAALRLSETLVSWFPVDDQGTYVGPRPFTTRLRVAPEVHFKGFGALAEFDVAAGAVAGNVPAAVVATTRVPVPAFTPIELRQLYVEYLWQSGLFRIGQQTSQWGLGILANAGAQDALPGDFGQQNLGNLVYRALLVGRPFYGLGGFWRGIEVMAAADLVYRDGYADFNLGDRAFQGVLVARYKVDEERYAGFWGVYRRQRAVGAIDGARATDAFVIDFAAKWQFLKRDDRSLNLGAEVVGIIGTTTQTRSDAAPISQVRQLGAAAKISYRIRSVSLLLDWGYASGDQNPYDDRLEGFRFDHNYRVGLVLFDQVLGYQTARAGLRAADPLLVGVPPEGVQAIPSGGGVFDAWYLFPRVRYGFTDWLDAYGGPLLAFSTAKLTDPYNTKVNGGVPTNYLGASPGDYLGTELDLGLQARWKPHRLLSITGTLEGGIFLPGSAFLQVNGVPMGPVALGRLRLQVAL